MKKRTIIRGLYILTGAMLVLVLFKYYLFDKPHMDVASEEAEYTLTASQLYNEFKSDEQSANKKYLDKTNGKVIMLTGSVSEININGLGEINLSINEKSMDTGYISCSLDSTEQEKVKRLEVGDKVTIKGQCLGYIELTDEVDLNKCILFDEE